MAPKAPKTDYHKLQDDEIEALKAIYPGDFEEVEVKGPWSGSSEKAFRLHLKPLQNPDIGIRISVKFPATYPKTLPIVNIDEVHNVREKSIASIKHIFKHKPKTLLGEQIITEITSEVMDILVDEAEFQESGATLPTLEEERAGHEAEAAKRAKVQEMRDLELMDRLKAEADEAMQHKIDEEIARGRALGRRRSVDPDPLEQALVSPLIVFDKWIKFQHVNEAITFNTVAAWPRSLHGPLTEVCSATPVAVYTKSKNPVGTPLDFALKTVVFDQLTPDEKNRVSDLEIHLDHLISMKRHENCAKVLHFRSCAVESGWEMSILMEFSHRGSLEVELKSTDTIPGNRLRPWTIDLLEALESDHQNQLVHSRIHARNILLFQSPNGAIKITLSDASFQQKLYDVKATRVSTSTYPSDWEPPELAAGQRTRKTDIWDLGIVFVQMLFGLGVTDKYAGPVALIQSGSLSPPLVYLLRQFFNKNPIKRPSAFEIIPSEFLKREHPISASEYHDQLVLSSGRRSSMNKTRSVRVRENSRYNRDFYEHVTIGKGGFGEVVRARSRFDKQLYAIKKISQKTHAQMQTVLTEVMILSQIKHHNVVRYDGAWEEDDTSPTPSEAVESDESDESTETGFVSTSKQGGLDFIHSEGIAFEHGSSDEEDEEDSDVDTDVELKKGGIDFAHSGEIVFENDSSDEEGDKPDTEAAGSEKTNQLDRRRTSSSSALRIAKSTLYIQMEYCEKKTLRDLIQEGTFREEEPWGIFRQIVEGLSAIHKRKIIHRDLKPDNIFIDKDNNPKIGDFGLATPGHSTLTGKSDHDRDSLDSELTKDIGTKLYTAPEISSNATGSYDTKVDMYSLGIIFFEMCYQFGTLMERIEVLNDLRDNCKLPEALNSPARQTQRTMVDWLVSHDPNERPSCLELLQSDKWPFEGLAKSIQGVKHVLLDPAPRHSVFQEFFDFLKANGTIASAWDHQSGKSFVKVLDTALLQRLTREKLCQIFSRHGAIEVERDAIFPVSTLYDETNCIQLITTSGTAVQLPYDLTVPGAREVARALPPADKTYTFGVVFRRNDQPNAAPKPIREASFDIASQSADEHSFEEAEVLKVMDEIVSEMPSLSVSRMALHLNHWDLLEMILEFCGINPSVRSAVKDVLSQLNIQNQTWSKLSKELRASPIGLSLTAVDHLAKFDFRDTPDKALARVRSLFGKTDYASRMKSIATHIQDVVSSAKELGVQTKMFVSPLGCAKHKFYVSGLMFQCVSNAKGGDVLAAGGRYDCLIAQHKPLGRGEFTGCRAVGMNLGFDRLVHSVAQLLKKKHEQNPTRKKKMQLPIDEKWEPRRCDVLVAALDARSLAIAGRRIVGHLWDHRLSAERAKKANSLDDVLAQCAGHHGWVVLVKSDATQDISEIRVHDRHTGQEIDVSMDNLVPHLKTEIKNRDRRMGDDEALPTVPWNQSTPSAKRAEVYVLVAQHKSKKFNRASVIEAAQARVQEVMESSGPVVAVEAADATLEALRGARLSDDEAWRRAAQAAPAAERDYVQQIRQQLGKIRDGWRERGGSRLAFIYNFRTGRVESYDLAI